MLAVEIEYKGKVTVLPVADKLVLFNACPYLDGRCLMDLVEYDHESGTKNIWYAGENLDSRVPISIADRGFAETTGPSMSEPCHCCRQLSKLERFRLIEQQLKSEGWL